MFRLIIFSCLLLANFAALARGRRRAQERILGGRDTYITEVPYQVSVQFAYQHTCGGSILGPQHIVTAAHCVLGKDAIYLTVRAGSPYHNYGGQYKDVESTTIHPKYNSSTSNYDAAVLKLTNPLTFGNTVKPLKLSSTEPKKGERVLISGWGVKKEGEKDPTLYLQSVEVPVVSRRTCEKKFKIINTVTSVMFCAGYDDGKKDACDGDSGGPAVVNGKLAGIVSWGKGCGHSYSPGVYTNVANIRHWIKTQTLY